MMAEKAAEAAEREAQSSKNKAMVALSVLEMRIKMQMSPMSYNKAGQVISRLMEAGYSEEDCNAVCRALFLDQKEDDMKDAWMLFSNGAPHIEADKFRQAHTHQHPPRSLILFIWWQVLPLMGEEMPEFQMDELFAMVDDDGRPCNPKSNP